MNQANDGDHHDDETPWLVIPYWAGDHGQKISERPLPPAAAPGPGVSPGVLSYLCDSISVVGGMPGVFTPGVPTTVAVTVRNYGKGAGLDLVSLDLWWSAPTTQFGSLTKKPPMAQAVGSLARDGLGAQPPLVRNMTFTTPPNAGPHICVLVRATVGHPILPGDPSPDGVPVWPADPTGDRHWGQHNLHTVVANANGGFFMSFSAANPTAHEEAFLVRATPVTGPALERLARELRATPASAEGASFAVRPLIDLRRLREKRGDDAGARPEAAVTIGGNRRMQMVLEGQLQRPPAPGEFAAFEVVQVDAGEARRPRKGKDRAPDPGAGSMHGRGSIGVVVFGAR